MIHTYYPKNREFTGQARYLKGMELTGLVRSFPFDVPSDLPEIDKADIVIIGGIIPFDVIEIKHNKIYYCFNSSFGQADLSGSTIGNEIAILSHVLSGIKAKKIHGCVTSSKYIADYFNFCYVHPLLNYNKENINFTPIDKRHGYGFLGNNIRKHKNTINQLIAISMLPKEPIYVGWGLYQHKDFFKNEFNIELTYKNLPSDKEYFEFISSNRLNFQCSFGESFDYQAFEYCLVGVPTVHSPCLDWYPDKAFKIKDVDNPFEICEIANRTLRNHVIQQGFLDKIPFWAQRYNEQQIEESAKILRKL